MPLIDPVTMSATNSNSNSNSLSSSSSTTTTTTTPSKKTASASSATTTTSAKSTTTEPSTHHPVHLHASSPAAQLARHVLPVLLAALFYAAFARLVADPVAALWAALPVVALLQVVYAGLCLPLAGSGGASAGKVRRQRPGEKKKDLAGSGPNFVITALVALLLSLLCAPVLHATMILFGAPLLTHAAHTLLCAAHLSILTLFPLFVVHGVDATAWLSLAAFKAPLDECYGGLLGGFLGAWLGAVPIPLDWDREWQKWPVTIMVGVYAGYVLGRVLGGSVLFGKRF